MLIWYWTDVSDSMLHLTIVTSCHCQSTSAQLPYSMIWTSVKIVLSYVLSLTPYLVEWIKHVHQQPSLMGRHALIGKYHLVYITAYTINPYLKERTYWLFMFLLIHRSILKRIPWKLEYLLRKPSIMATQHILKYTTELPSATAFLKQVSSKYRYACIQGGN